jgi:hypothetical protein
MALSFDREDVMVTDEIAFSSAFGCAEGLPGRIDMG